MKRLSQHFLIDDSILDRLVGYGGVSKEDVVLEVGAGTGELTWRLAEKAYKVIAIEIDGSLLMEASKKLMRYNNVELIRGDILKLRNKIKGFNKVVSNPPYHISTKLMHWIIINLPERIVLTLQKEFAQKITSPPGSKKYVYTSFVANLFYESRIVEEVPRSLFKPMPRVESAIIVMERINNQITVGQEELDLIKMLFTQRTRKLRRVLSSMATKLQLNKKEIENMLPDGLMEERIYRLEPARLYELARNIMYLKIGQDKMVS